MINENIASKDFNTTMLLNSIIVNQPISRADLAKMNNLNKTTTSAIVTNLINDKLVYESGVGESTVGGGRKPILLKFNYKSALAISLELGSNYINSAIAYLNGDIIHYNTVVNIEINKKNIHQQLVKEIDELLKKTPKTPNGLVGISVAVHGVTLNNKLTFSPFYDFGDYDIQEELSKQYQCPLFIENEANLAAIGEYTYSTNQNRIININIKSGIGAGITQDGLIQKGAHGRFGEIGHTILFPNGTDCPCGNKGCLERYASLNVLCENIRQKKNLDFLDISDIIDFWEQKDRVVTNEVLTNIEYLSIGINNLISSFDPDEIIINSPLFNQNPKFLIHLKENLRSRLTRETKLSVSKLTDKATVYGGLAIVNSAYLNILNLKFLDI